MASGQNDQTPIKHFINLLFGQSTKRYLVSVWDSGYVNWRELGSVIFNVSLCKVYIWSSLME